VGAFNVKVELEELGLGGIDLSGLAKTQACWGSCECGDKSSISIKYWEFLELQQDW
jgi:hypothetical protein